MPTITIDSSGWKRLSKNLKDYVRGGILKDVERASHKIADLVQTHIKSGRTADDNPMPLVSEATMKSPIRHGSDKAIRGEVRSSRTPLFARGGSIKSIKSRKKGAKFVVGPTTPKAQMIFDYNATKAKVKRDPIVVSEAHLDFIEKEILNGLDKIIRG